MCIAIEKKSPNSSITCRMQDGFVHSNKWCEQDVSHETIHHRWAWITFQRYGSQPFNVNISPSNTVQALVQSLILIKIGFFSFGHGPINRWDFWLIECVCMKSILKYFNRFIWWKNGYDLKFNLNDDNANKLFCKKSISMEKSFWILWILGIFRYS